MNFPDIDPSAIDNAIRSELTPRQRRLIETIESAKRLIERFIKAKAKEQLAHDSYHGSMGRLIPCGGNKNAVPGGWIGTGGPRVEPECWNCRECWIKAKDSARGTELALNSMIELAAELQADLDAIFSSRNVAGVTYSDRRGKADMDSRYGGYHD